MISTTQPSALSVGKTARQSKTVTFSGSNTTVATALFRVVGAVRFLKLYGIVTTTIGVNHTAGYFRLNDQSAQVEITDNAVGATLSGFFAGGKIEREDLSTVAAVVKDAAVGGIIEASAKDVPVNVEFSVIKKSGANTDIEYVYTTTDTPTSGAIQFFVEYQLLSDDASVTAL